MTVFTVDPLRDPRWLGFLERHPRASVFHTPGWLDALRRTYGYEPVVFTTSPPSAELANGLVFCRVKSWLTGRRLVSLPFSDHCEPLADSAQELALLIDSIERQSERENWRYIELRPLISFDPELSAQVELAESESFYLHKLDLRPDLNDLFRSFHKKGVQRMVQRAQREGLTYEEGRSQALLSKFYRLLLLTRRRHQIPPQPLAWFRNLMDCLGENLTIRVVFKDGEPIASIQTLSYKNSIVYKYGCSDAGFHNLGGMPLLLWQTIEDGKRHGAREFDLGRSEPGQEGLVTFKEHWGAARSKLSYYRYSARLSQRSAANWRANIARQVCARLPDALLTVAGKLLYRHVG